ncbi:hypothetical protein COW36_14315 [bacterium (Candidatus Blackallbacteria) CG17_big_fil_post_rev_8_21_14_2_50_48_46]|uniref:EF-hand domain-containing protein n=1 Tax=bacterium (Candidatus Blackallbacteria) CG17_big_fil_post_rev_8_21_14_2_50_48_46 TaxID=2014261 RepID=A0A2M7G378_9BACT|nr:MAG: hypothetical protein COW64_08840 [bacterium (Candidatus Blackallbacteria) CG18_big_fil_WC_8_21_14_2_50_49_26]PIW16135.1 MAG: hypothetical protein COW36_14315 [bacterium (Candidatus Blackallbacteria) CG17_big_fil_post_rev_8_21_14_2_50_48_46]PIW44222.1 MAG: hypothetical protein COW20_24645 [bacterium (Candidatus Blackallbacteria) CG13_big_fil_rev_8_21_14_2_50_49_14]
MKSFYTALGVAAALFSLNACQSQLPVNAPAVTQTLRSMSRSTSTKASGTVRSNAGLDIVIGPLRQIYFKNIDRDHNGYLSGQEVNGAYLQDYASQFDTNKDGLINETEFVNTKIKIVPGANGGYGMYVPTRESLRQMMKTIWSQIDKDRNNLLTIDEYMSFAAPPMPAVPIAPPTGTDGSCNNGCAPTDPSSGYDPGYGAGYGSGYGGYDQTEIYRKQIAQQAFQMGDKNLDKLMNFSEFEDLQARLLLASSSQTIY